MAEVKTHEVRITGSGATGTVVVDGVDLSDAVCEVRYTHSAQTKERIPELVLVLSGAALDVYIEANGALVDTEKSVCGEKPDK